MLNNLENLGIISNSEYSGTARITEKNLPHFKLFTYHR